MTLTTECITLNKDRNVTLTAMLQRVDGELAIAKRPDIIILPGGGYSVCSDREAEVVAYPFLSAGYDAFILRYSVGEHKRWPNPLEDFDSAMEYILSNAEAFGIANDKIAVVGFSAGGHLAASAITLAKHKPNAALLIYAATEKKIAEACQPGVDIPSPTDHISVDTPPCFIVAARDDTTVPMENQLRFMDALDKNGVTFECRIYSHGGHGFSTGLPSVAAEGISRRIPNWVSEGISFLEDIFGKATANGFTAPVCPSHQNANHEKYLSVHCTIAHVMKYSGESPELQALMRVIDSVVEARFQNKELAMKIIGGYKLLELLGMLGKTKKEIEELDLKLREIKNDGR